MDPVGLDNLRNWIPLVTIPFTVMGGIKNGNIRSVRQAGACRFAMVTELSAAPDVAGRYRQLKESIS
jgi:thiamine monophosphate synthase